MKISKAAAVLLFSVFLFLFMKGPDAAAEEKKISLDQANSLAAANSQDYVSVNNKLELSKIQYVQSVKAIQLKQKNQSSFRWTPLLNFKFPEKPDLSDEYTYTYKPLELQSKIDKLKHEKTDCVFGIYEKVSLQFLKAYVLQEKIAYDEKRMEALNETLGKNRARLLLGEANQADIDTAEKKLVKLEQSLASDMRSFEAAKEKLSDLTGLNLTVSYTFLNPFVKADITRASLNGLINYTLANDHGFYLARTDTANGLLALNTNYNLMKNQYGSDMGYIDSYIDQARRGEKLNSAAFRLKYDELLAAVDRPWQGYKKILFIRFPKEWFKGAIDGVRYVEDEPYVLYEAALEYQGLYADEQNMKKELTDLVKDSFENYISARNAWESVKKDLKEKEKELDRSMLLNRLGEMTFEEYFQVQEEYEELKISELDAVSSYSQILYSFDRLTCGAVKRLMKGENLELETAAGGESYVVEEEAYGAYYYIHSLAADNVFELGISVPDDFEIEITDFELWINKKQVGERTPVTRPIRHLTLALDNVENAFVRLYDNGNLIDDCVIDVTAWSGKLPIVTEYRIEKNEETLLGSYSAFRDPVTGLFELTVTPQAELDIGSYNLKTEDGSYLLSDSKLDIKRTFCYLSAAEMSLGELTICFYGKDGALLYEGEFHTADRSVHKKKDA